MSIQLKSLNALWVFCLGLLAANCLYATEIAIGRATINVSVGPPVTWEQVTFFQTYNTIPVVVTSPTNQNTDPATIRIRNVTTTGFEVGVVEPQDSDGQTTIMNVEYFVAESGTYTFGGSTMIVGTATISNFQGRNFPGSASWVTQNFGHTFSADPAVVTQIQTINSQPGLESGVVGEPFLEVAMRSLGTSSMQIALETAETSTGTIVAETVGYIAMDSGGLGAVGGALIHAAKSPDNVRGWDNGCFSNNFPTAFGGTPLAVVSQNSRDGGDGGWARRCSINNTSYGVAIDEDIAGDSERAHTTEDVSVLAVSTSFLGTHGGLLLEAAAVAVQPSNNASNWTSVTFDSTFTTTPRVFSIPTSEGNPPAALRLRNITTTGFDIAAFNPPGSAGSHPQMTIDYVAIPEGVHELINGDIFEVGSVTTNAFISSVETSTGPITLNFSETYSAPPSVIFEIQTINNELGADPQSVSNPWLTVGVESVSSTSASFSLDKSEVASAALAQQEVIAYFAVPDGTENNLSNSDGDTLSYEMFNTPSNIEGWEEGCFNNSFSNSYLDPHVIATKTTRNGNNGGWIRRCNLQANQVGLTVDEDTDNDSDRSHIDEEASVFVFSGAFFGQLIFVDYYDIEHSGLGVTCEAELVTIRARDEDDNETLADNRTITISATSTTTGWSATDASWTLVSGSGIFNDLGNGEAEYTFASGESSVQLNLANVSEADIDIDIVDNEDSSITDLEGTADDPVLSYSEAGFRFYDDANGDGNADGTSPIASPLVAGQASGNLILRAVQTDTETGACISRVTGSQTVSMSYVCVDPGTCIRNQDGQVNATAIEENNVGSIVDLTPVSLTFDAQGEASFSFTYFDVGAVQLYAALTLPATSDEPAITLEGQSGSTVVRPADFVVTSVVGGGGEMNPQSTTTGSGFIPASAPFSVEVEVRNATGGLTPNYGNEGSPEGITVLANNLVMPVGGNLAVLNQADQFTVQSPGVFLNQLVNWPEAGTITVSARVADGDYLGAGNTLGATSGNIGRFYPEFFNVLSSAVVPECIAGNFSYMSDALWQYLPVAVSYEITAETLLGDTLMNYDSASLGFPVGAFEAVAESQNNGVDLSARTSLPAGDWVNGELIVTAASNAGFRRALTGVNETVDGPFTDLILGLRPASSNIDPTELTAGDLTMNATSIGDCTADTSCNSYALGAGHDFYFGRMTGESAHGPETATLNVPLFVEVYNGSNFVLNTNDSCSETLMSDIQFAGSALSNDANRTVPIGAGATTGTFTQFTPTVDFDFLAGEAGLSFSPPGAGNTGSFLIEIDLTNLPHFRFDWDGNGSTADNTSPPDIEVSFGNFRGHDRIIHWREKY